MRSPNKTLSRLALVIFIIGYWIFIWALERVDYSQSPPSFWVRLVGLYPLFDILTSRLTIIFEFFSPRVLRHFIPVVTGWWLARTAVKYLLTSYYDLPDTAAAGTLLNRFLASRTPAMSPVGLNRNSFDLERKKNPILRIGGPGRVGVRSGEAVVTERVGRYQRVLGPGAHTLGRFEYPFAVVDVRPQERKTNDVKVMTIDGIELITEIGLTFQISHGQEVATRERPFPFDSESVRKAVYSQMNSSDQDFVTWDSMPLNVAQGQLGNIIAEYRLDELVFSDQPEVHIHRQLKNELERRTKSVMRNAGVDILSIQLGQLKPPKQVTEQYIDYWRAYWLKQQRIREGEGKAVAIEEAEIARAEAEAMMVEAILEGLQRARRRGERVSSKDIAALRLFESLETLARDSQDLVQLPDSLLPRMGELRKQLLPGDEQVGQPADS